MFAVFETGSKQYRVSKDSVIKVEKIDSDIGSQIQFESIMLLDDNGKLTVGSPYIKGSSVQATVISQGRAKKIMVMKMKRRKRYRRNQGHRQYFTKLRIDGINVE